MDSRKVSVNFKQPPNQTQADYPSFKIISDPPLDNGFMGSPPDKPRTEPLPDSPLPKEPSEALGGREALLGRLQRLGSGGGHTPQPLPNSPFMMRRLGRVDQPMPKPPKVSVSRQDKTTVFIRVVFLKLGEIHTVQECFTAEAFIQAKWRAAELDGTPDIKSSEVKWEDCWSPKLYIDNTVGDPRETIWRTVTFNANQEAFIYERRRIKGVFMQNMDLRDFPFDTQDLTLTILSERTEAELDLEEDCSELSSINVQSFVDEQEWKLHSNIETTKSVMDKIFQGSSDKHPALATRCHASRRVGFYIFNMFVVMFIICTMSFATFAITFDLTAGRLQLTLILLLTTITFKFAVMQILPKISYLTYLDYYILSSMGLYALIGVWHALVATIIPDYLVTVRDETERPAQRARIKRVDQYFLMTLGSLHVLAHVSFCVFVYVWVMRKRRIHLKRESEQKAKMRVLKRQSTPVLITY